MPEIADHPPKPLRTWRPMAAWVWVCAAVVVFLLVGCGSAPSKAPQSPPAQDKPGSDTTTEKNKDTYVPKDLDDCFVQLKKILKPEDIEKMKRGTEDAMAKYHFGLGLWMRNNWRLWAGSRLAKWFNGQGIKHPDDMSGIILTSFWRHLNGRPINLEEQVKYYQDYWKTLEDVQPTPVGEESPK